jgi:hypothetical protein
VSENSSAPRKRAPRKATAKAIAEEGPAGVTSSTAQAAREQLEAAGGEVTAGAVARLRASAAEREAAADRSVAGALAARDRMLAAVPDDRHVDDPGPAEPDDDVAELAAVRAYDPPPADDDPKPADDLDDAGPDRGIEADLAAARGEDVDADQVVGHTDAAGGETRTARETAPRAAAGANGRDDDYTAAAIDVDQAGELSRQAEASPAAPPPGVTMCGPGTPTVGDAAQVADFARQLEAATRPNPAHTFTAGSAMLTPPGLADDDDFDVHQLLAVDVAGPEAFDVRVLVAGRVETAPAGSRVTVVDWPGVDDAAGPRMLPVPAGNPGGPAGTLARASVWDRAAAIVETMNAAAQIGDVVDLDGDGTGTVVLSPADAAAIEEARDLEARAAELKEAAEAIRSRVKEALGGETGRGETAVDANGVPLATWSRYTETRLDGTALKKAHPDVWAQFAKTSARRRFTWAD